MRRRLDLAAALVARPPVLFLDEPTTGLDPRSRIALWEAIEARTTAGTTVLLTTQYLDEADRLCDRIGVIDHGTLIAEGTPDELKDRVGGERLEVRLAEGGSAEDALEALAPMAEDRPSVEDGVVRVPMGRRAGVIAEAVRRLDAASVGVDDIALRRPTLDDVFFALTGRHAEPEEAARRGRRGRRAGDRSRARGGAAMSGLRYALADASVIAKRNLKRIQRQPDLAVGFTVQPIMFVLLFVLVFGGAIATPGFEDYTDFLMPGIIVQTMAFGGFVTALSLAEDMKKGLIDRFRSLPMARSAVLAGRTFADVLTNTVSLTIMIVVGFVVGFSFHNSVPEVIAGIALLLLFGYVFSWVFSFVGISSSSPEAANAFGFMAIFPLTFASSAFVPIDTLPAASEAFAEVNPFTQVVDAVRALFLGVPAGDSIWLSLVWSFGLLAIFLPLSVAKYRKAVTS